MSATIAMGVAGLCLVIALFIQWKRKYDRMPPGPTPLPLIGNMHHINSSRLAVEFLKLGKKYGDVFTVHIFTTPWVIINSNKAIKDLVASPEYSDIFSGRVNNYFSKHLLPDDLLFQTVTDGQQYMRRLVMRGIKQYGTSLKRVEHIVQRELELWLQKAKEMNGSAYDSMSDINLYLGNIIWILVCGERFAPDHRVMEMTRELADDFTYLFGYRSQVLMDSVPFSTMIPSKLQRCCRRLIKNNNNFTEYCTNMRKEGKSNTQECLLALLEKEHSEGKISLNNIKGITLDLIITGIFTTAPTIYTTLLALVHFQDVQKKIQEEIGRVVGTDRLPNLDDQHNLPYTHAFILEIFRYFSPDPLPGPRATIADCTYMGYHIPKDTLVTYNVMQVHHDEEFWDNPWTFDPTRFLDTEGNILPPDHEKRLRLITFGLGKRSCVGEVLARVRIYLAISSILQQFDLQKDPSFPIPPADPREYDIDFMVVPPPYKIRFVPRK